MGRRVPADTEIEVSGAWDIDIRYSPFTFAIALPGPSELRPTMTAKPEDHFPDDYRAARDLCRGGGSRGDGLTTRVHPNATGLDGKPLFLDIATAGPRDAKRRFC